MDDISIRPEDAPNVMAQLVENFCAMPADYSDIPVVPDKLDAREHELLIGAVTSVRAGDAAEAYRAIAGREHASFEFYYLLGKILFERKCYYEASNAFMDALLRSEEYGEVWFHLGMANYQMGLVTEAFSNWAEAVRANPNHEDGRLLCTLVNSITNNADPLLHPEAAATLPIVEGKGIDIGCGTRKIHPDAIGVNLSEGGETGVAGETGRVSTANIQASGDDLGMFSDGELDYVIARHNLEHYVDPLKTLQEWGRVLKTGGVIGLVLPDDDAFDTIRADTTPAHVFTQSSLKNIVSLLPELAMVEQGVCEKGSSFYAIVEKVAPGSKPVYPYRERVDALRSLQVAHRAELAVQAGIQDVAAAAIRKLEELRPNGPLPADPDTLHPFPFGEAPSVTVAGGGLRVAVFQYPQCTKDWARTLDAMGHAVLEIPLGHRQKISLSAENRIKDLRPDLVVSANYRPHAARSLALFNIPCVCWAIDTFALDDYWRRDLVDDNTHLFHFSKIETEKFQRIGLKNAAWLPLAANVERFRPSPIRKEYACDIGFVETSSTVNGYTDLMNRLKTALMNAALPAEGKNKLLAWVRKTGEVIERHQETSTEWRGRGLLEEVSGAALPPELAGMSLDAVLIAIGDQVTANQCAALMHKLAPLGLHLWGDNGWRRFEPYGASYRGVCGYYNELPEIYSSSKINLHTNRVYDEDVTPQRVFDVLACRGFLLAEHRDAYAGCYEIGKELVCYSSIDEARELAEHYLAHPEEREAIAEAGYRATVERHSLKSRWAVILETLAERDAIDRRRAMVAP